MGTINDFTEIIAWQKAEDLAIKLRECLELNKDFSYCDQIRRASLSIMNNIAEGYGRYGSREFRQFLSIAKGSDLEVQSMLYLGKKLQYFDQNKFEELMRLTHDINNLLKALIRSIQVNRKSE